MTIQPRQTSQSNLYFLHTPEESWTPEDAQEIHEFLASSGFKESNDAAIGEGAGGLGWETVVEFVLSTSAVASLTEQIWRIIKFLKTKKPKEKAPNGQEIYRAVFHTKHGRIAVDLTTPIEDLDVAINEKLSLKIIDGELHVFDQSGKDWHGY